MESRAPFELGTFMALSPLMRLAPRGEGQPVLVLPGLSASDVSTGPLRRYLGSLGHATHGWRLGRNDGPTDRIVGGLVDRIATLHERSGAPVQIVGWSLGGVYGLAVARTAPQVVRRVVTLGSPLSALGARGVPGVLRRRARERFGRSEGPPSPLTSIWSRTDAVVPWRSSRVEAGPGAENVEVRASHFGLGVNAAAALVVADRLALPDRTLTPFAPHRTVRRWYPDPDRTDAETG